MKRALRRDELHQILDAAIDLRENFSKSSQSNIFRKHQVATLIHLSEVLISQLTEGYLDLPRMRVEAAAGSPEDVEQYRNDFAKNMLLAPSGIPHEHRKLLSESLLKLNDGSRDAPPFLRPLILRKNEVLPKEAQEFRLIICRWIDWSIGAGSSSEDAIKRVNKCHGSPNIKTIQAWRTAFRKMDFEAGRLKDARKLGETGQPLFQGPLTLEHIVLRYGEAAARLSTRKAKR